MSLNQQESGYFLDSIKSKNFNEDILIKDFMTDGMRALIIGKERGVEMWDMMQQSVIHT